MTKIRLSREILKAIYIPKPTSNQLRIVCDILKHEHPMHVPNTICERLGIEKRYNRSTIQAVYLDNLADLK